MIELIVPEEIYLPSYLEAYDEYAAHEVKHFAFDNPRTCDVFQKYDDYRQERNLRPDRVGADYYWLVNSETREFIGQISIRHRLNDALRLCGGHIGYGIRLSRWNQGYGTLMLKMALEKVRERGIQRALCTCDEENTASARVMEHNGFVLEDKVWIQEAGEKRLIRRYWKTLERNGKNDV